MPLGKILSILLAVSFISGCGGQDGPQRFRISGAVSYDGKPVPFGTITFDPDSMAGNSGPQAAAMIVDGKYDTGIAQGVVGGPHIVRITGSSRQPTSTDPNSEPLFDNYEVKEDFEKQTSTKDFSVKKRAGTTNTLPKKPLRPEQQP